MWNLASYYMAREFPSASGKAYFDANLCINVDSTDPLDFRNQWLTAYEVDVGQPTDTTTVVQHGTQSCDPQEYKIFQRHYSKALILVRARGGYNCTDYGDATTVTVPLATSMVMLEADGTYSAPMTSAPIRNGEAVILFPAPDTTAPARVPDLQAQ